MAVAFGELIREVERLAPPHYAQSWDNTGLQVGSPEADVRTVLVAMDATRQVVEEGARKNAEALVVHHPLLFGTVSSMRSDRWPGCVVTALIAAGCGLYVAHTNLDAAPRTNSSAALARALGLREVRPLASEMPDDLAAISVRLEGPADEAVVAELTQMGSEVRHGSRAGGSGTPGGSMLEVVCPRARLAANLDVLGQWQTGETRVLDVRPVLGRPPFPNLGVVGKCEPKTLEGLAGTARSGLGLAAVGASAAGDGEITEVAAVAGSAKGAFGRVVRSGAQAMVAGEIGHHLAVEAAENGIAAIEVGHFASERPAMAHLAELLREVLGDRLAVVLSTEEAAPFSYQ
jgi:dinuclear metal center YbgI/SA1388 family protein